MLRDSMRLIFRSMTRGDTGARLCRITSLGSRSIKKPFNTLQQSTLLKSPRKIRLQLLGGGSSDGSESCNFDGLKRVQNFKMLGTVWSGMSANCGFIRSQKLAGSTKQFRRK